MSQQHNNNHHNNNHNNNNNNNSNNIPPPPPPPPRIPPPPVGHKRGPYLAQVMHHMGDTNNVHTNNSANPVSRAGGNSTRGNVQRPRIVKKKQQQQQQEVIDLLGSSSSEDEKDDAGNNKDDDSITIVRKQQTTTTTKTRAAPPPPSSSLLHNPLNDLKKLLALSESDKQEKCRASLNDTTMDKYKFHVNNPLLPSDGGAAATYTLTSNKVQAQTTIATATTATPPPHLIQILQQHRPTSTARNYAKETERIQTLLNERSSVAKASSSSRRDDNSPPKNDNVEDAKKSASLAWPTPPRLREARPQQALQTLPKKQYLIPNAVVATIHDEALWRAVSSIASERQMAVDADTVALASEYNIRLPSHYPLSGPFVQGIITSECVMPDLFVFLFYNL